MTHGPFVSPWVGVTVGVITMIFVAAHAMSLRTSDMPASRRRIRQANAGLIVVLVPLLVAGTSLVNPSKHPVIWMQVWIAAMLLLTAVIGFAAMDMLNTIRLSRHRKAALAKERAELERAADASRAKGSGDGAS